MSAVPAGTLISSILVARNCRSTLERREKSGIFWRSSTLVVTDRSFTWSASYHAPRYWFAVGVVLRRPVRILLGPPRSLTQGLMFEIRGAARGCVTPVRPSSEGGASSASALAPRAL